MGDMGIIPPAPPMPGYIPGIPIGTPMGGMPMGGIIQGGGYMPMPGMPGMPLPQPPFMPQPGGPFQVRAGTGAMPVKNSDARFSPAAISKVTGQPRTVMPCISSTELASLILWKRTKPKLFPRGM
mmetsp:Transcript_15950/g.43373  ORF Transcript_15950/g.43373 Transcript_15950/m.43373 type:complete len:125 (+) Transcript_15950:1266-1640(+)